MSDGAVLDAVMEDRGTIVPGYDKDKKPFPAWTVYFECGDIAAYNQHDVRLLRAGEPAAESLRRFLGHLGFEAREEDFPVPVVPALSRLKAERVASGEVIEVPWEYRGDILPGWDANQNPFRAVSSYFEIGNQSVYCFTDKLKAFGAGVDPVARHKEECIAFLLAKYGLRVTAEAFA